MTIQAAIAACQEKAESLARPHTWRGSGAALKIKPGEKTFLKVTPLSPTAYTGHVWQPSVDDLLSRWELVTLETLLEEARKDDSGKRYQDFL